MSEGGARVAIYGPTPTKVKRSGSYNAAILKHITSKMRIRYGYNSKRIKNTLRVTVTEES